MADEAMGLSSNPGKGQAWGTNRAARRSLSTVHAYAAHATMAPKIMGVVVSTSREVRTMPQLAVNTCLARLDRIRTLVCSRGTRKSLVKSLVMPVVCWASAWTRPTKAEVRIFLTATERAVLGVRRVWVGRSRALIWAAGIGPGLAADFVLAFGFWLVWFALVAPTVWPRL